MSDLERSIEWYTRHCGFVCTRRSEKSPAGNQLAFLEIPGNAHFLELCHSPDYVVKFPEDLMHTCIGVPDIVAWCARLEEAGVAVWPGEWKKQFTSGGRKMAFITDPDGYEVEILETP